MKTIYLVHEVYHEGLGSTVPTKAFTHEQTMNNYVNTRAICPMATSEIELIEGEVIYKKEKF